MDNINNEKSVKDVHSVAASANAATYDSVMTQKYIQSAPHVKYRSLRELYAKLVVQVYHDAKKTSVIPRVLDLGAGEGSTTLQFLELGAHVTAVDISKSQLALLEDRCKLFKQRLEIQEKDVEEFLHSRSGELYDVVVVSSFLHHIPDYLGLIKKIIVLLPPHGQFFSFQDPLRYDSVGKFTKVFADFAHCSWRIFQGDVIGGIKRRIRRSRGIYLDDCESDNVEYHAARNGVDQNAIAVLLEKEHFNAQIISYFSTQGVLFQSVGEWLRLKNTFAVIARR